jgi:hypothetical protein
MPSVLARMAAGTPAVMRRERVMRGSLESLDLRQPQGFQSGSQPVTGHYTHSTTATQSLTLGAKLLI